MFVDASTNTMLTPDGPMEGVTILSLQTFHQLYIQGESKKIFHEILIHGIIAIFWNIVLKFLILTFILLKIKSEEKKKCVNV